LIHFYKRVLNTERMWLWVLLVCLTTVVQAYESDSYGRFERDRYGYRKYTYCYDRYRYPEDQCRDRYKPDRVRADINDVDRTGVYVGKGYYKEYRNDVELTCEFPQGTNLISNIVWEKVEDTGYRPSRYSTLQDTLGRRMQVRRIGDYGSRLTIVDWERRDKGVYRCVGSRAYNGYNRYSETVYMDVVFNPSYSNNGGYNGRSDDFSSYFARDDYDDNRRYDRDNRRYDSDNRRYDSRYDQYYYPGYRSLLIGSKSAVVAETDKGDQGIIQSTDSE